MSSRFDVAIVGSGFAGALLALVARRLGRSVVLLERGTHPRFAIGESSSPLANLLLEELSDRYDLPRIRPFSKWGTWQQEHPGVACGLKRGFSFFRHELDRPFENDREGRDQLLVESSPRDAIADTHWYRPDFDAILVDEAKDAGTIYLDRARLDSPRPSAGGFVLEGERSGARFSVEARVVFDTAGRQGFLSRAFDLTAAPPSFYPDAQCLFTHFRSVSRIADLSSIATGGAPFPVDDAAVHHVFDGGWIWVLRFGNGITSAGASVRQSLAERVGLGDGENGWSRLLARIPSVREQFLQAQPLLPFQHLPRMSFRMRQAAGPNWALLPSAAAFVDPLLSTGFPLALLGVQRLASALEEDWGTSRLAPRLISHGETTLAESDRAALLISALTATTGDFPLFVSVSLLYFAAASFTESVRRLGHPERATGFLCEDHPTFGADLESCCRTILDSDRPLGTGAREALIAEIHRAIEPIDVAGLLRTRHRHWYPMDVNDLFASAHKLGAERDDIEALLLRCGLSEPDADVL